MINSLSSLIIPMIFMVINTQAQVGFEQYYYVKNKERIAFVPIFNYESHKNWYVEGRYNYEEMNTFSFYVGKNFAHDEKLTYSVIPMVGAVVGQFKGGSAGVNAVIEYQGLFFSTQSQYTLSFDERSPDFFFAWSELGYQPWKWFYFGLSTQQTYLPQTNSSVSEPGIVLGFAIGKWTFPLYSFSPMSNSKYFVLGVNLSVGAFNRNSKPL